jgi:hypothetical protein
MVTIVGISALTPVFVLYSVSISPGENDFRKVRNSYSSISEIFG